ncbi:MAG TPA: glycosyltransferase [Gemmatimonadaceae bacterium]|jgi:glycosyltransferase involved in cell wall biosynthesis
MRVSVIVRTYNEQRHLPQLLEAIAGQRDHRIAAEVVLVDSGSTDQTVRIAEAHGVRVLHIERERFSFGRSLNVGCAAARGDYLVFVSGHCVPTDDLWLSRLIEPLHSREIGMTYGRQVGGPETRFSEHQLFDKFFPAISQIPQTGFFCNNANSALRRVTWERYRFDEELTGLEDMDLAKRLVGAGLRIGYVADACVYHHHHETWSAVRRRYEREAIALQQLLPDVRISIADFVRYFGSAVMHDLSFAGGPRRAATMFREIVLFRLMQFWGSYRGNHVHRELSRTQKESYFYPRGDGGHGVTLAQRSFGPPHGSTHAASFSTDVIRPSNHRVSTTEGEQRTSEGQELSTLRWQAPVSLDS